MAQLLVRRSNQWLGFGTGPDALTVTMVAPSTSGQTKQLPFTFAANTSDNAAVTKVELYYLVGGNPTYLGETSTLSLGWAVPLPADFPAGTWDFFMRAYTTGGFSDSAFVTTTITAGAATLDWLQPSTNGQTLADPVVLAIGSSNPSAFTTVNFFRRVGGSEDFLGNTSTYGQFGFTVSVSGLTGAQTVFARANTTDGGSVTSVDRTLTIGTATSPPGASSLKTAVYFGGEDQHWTEAQARMGYKLSGRMRFVVRASASQCLSDFTNQIDSTIARRNTDRYMMWLTFGLVMNNDTGGLQATANGDRNASLWVPAGQQLNRLTADDLANLVGLRLGHEFMNAGDDYRWGVRNTTYNSTNLLTNAARLQNAWRMAVDTMKAQLSTQAKKDALQLDWNAPGGQMIRTMTHAGGVNAWTLADACYPGDAYVSHITADIYPQERFRTTAPNYVAINGPDSPLAWVKTRAIQHGKKSGMSEGSGFMYKWKNGAQIGSDDGSVNLTFLNDLLDWGTSEAQAGRLSHITFFERDPYAEGFTAFIGGQKDTSARPTGTERLWGLWRLLHPREAKTGGGFIPGGIPDYATGVPNTLSRRYTAYTAVGGTRTRSVHSNAPQAAKALLDRVNP